MAVYPSNIPTTSDLPDAGADLSSNPHSALHDDVRDEVIAIAGELGVSPSGTESTVRARLDAGLGLREVVTFTSNGTFTKATYPWLRAVRVRVQGGGGGGGGAATTGASQVACGTSGGGAAYAESFILASALGSSETVTVGAGGAGGAAGNNAGVNGGATSFGSLVSASAGIGGAGAAASANANVLTSTAAAQAGGVGDLVIPSMSGSTGFQAVGGDFQDFRTRACSGGHSFLGSGGEGRGNSGNGAPGLNYGGGGSAGLNTQSQATARTGGAGAQGIVIVELYA